VESLNVHLVDPMKHMYYAGRTCSDCDEDLMLSEDVVTVEIALPQLHEGAVLHVPFENPDGTYAYEPYVFHEHCWGESSDRLHQILEDQCCRAKPDAYAYTQCSACNSGIRLNEPVGLVQYGQLTASKRTPNGEASVVFTSSSRPPMVLCLACIRTMNEEVIEMWESVSYNGECPVCTYDRVWRDGEICTHQEES
jgi:hypothetical protein